MMTIATQPRPCLCDRLAFGQPYRDGECRACWLYYHDAYYRELWGGGPLPTQPPQPRPKLRPPCRHLGAETRRQLCESCNGHVELKVFKCQKHGECTAAKRAPGVNGCCADGCWEAPDAGPTPAFTVGAEPSILTIDPNRLLPGRCFNCSLIIHKGRRLLAYRKEWAGARIIIAELDADWQPVANHRVYWRCYPHDNSGQEDPRLFLYRGQLHLSYTTYDGQSTSVGYVRLRDDLTAEAAWAPSLTPRQPWEKNWVMFDHEGELYAIYQTTPHTILRIHERHAERVYETHWQPDWKWGELRGGASPVFHNGEWYHFFHARMPQHNGQYSIGVLTFEAKPPFRVTRFCPRPLVLCQPKDKPEAGVATVVYPGSATLHEDRWHVAAGWLDSACRIYSWLAEQIENELRAV